MKPPIERIEDAVVAWAARASAAKLGRYPLDPATEFAAARQVLDELAALIPLVDERDPNIP